MLAHCSDLWLMNRFGPSHVFHRPLDGLLLLPEWAAAASFALHPLHRCSVQLRMLAGFAQNTAQCSISSQPSASRPAGLAGVTGHCERPDSLASKRSGQQLSRWEPQSAQHDPIWRPSSWRWRVSGRTSAAHLSTGGAPFAAACHTSAAQRHTRAGWVTANSLRLSRISSPAVSGSVRQHSSAASDQGGCWRCDTPVPSGAAFFCPSCGAILPADPSLSFYTVMGMCAVLMLLPPHCRRS